MKIEHSMLCVEDGCREVYASTDRPHLDCPACGSRNPFPLARAVESANAPGMAIVREMSKKERAA